MTTEIATAADPDQDILSLIDTLLATERRLVELTAGQVDAVADTEGRTFLLRRAQEHLRAGDAGKQSAIIDALPAHLALLDPRGRIVSVNEGWRKFGRASGSQITEHGVGSNYLDICDRARGDGSSEAVKVAEGIRAVIDGREKRFATEYPCPSPTEAHWFLLTVTPLSSEIPCGVVVLHLDITERKLAEMAALRLAAIVESSNDAIIGEDVNSVVSSWNRGAEAIFGYTAAEMIGTPSTRLIPAEGQADEALIRNRILLGENLEQYETLRRTKAGRMIDVSLTLSPIKDGVGKVAGIAMLARDITERKRTEEALRDSEARFRQFAENVQEVFWMATPDFGEMLYVSPAYERIWGRSIAGLYQNPRDWIDAILPEDRQVAIDTFARLEQGATLVNLEYRIRPTDGTTRSIQDRGFPIRSTSGRLVGMAGIAADITDRKRQEDGRRHSQKMEVIGQLAGGIAHDFNNILGCILGYAELALMDTQRNERSRQSLEMVLRASHRAKNLVLQILTFSRRQELERKPIKLHTVISEALNLQRATWSSGIELELDIDVTAPTVLADATQVHQIILNLTANAVHAMKGSGKLGVTLAAVEVDSEVVSESVPEWVGTLRNLEAGRHARVSVSDTGCGMDTATLQRLFEPFFTTKPAGEGTGLGLAVVHGIMRDHDGAVTVYSEPGRGSVFHLYFPAESRPAVDVAPAMDTIVLGSGQRILVVDDEPSLASLFQKILERAGYRVTVHTNAMSALAEFRTRPSSYDLVLTDLTMPIMSGSDLAAELLRIRPDLRIVLATGFGGAMTSAKAQVAGIREVIMKPATARSLTECMHRVLSLEE